MEARKTTPGKLGEEFRARVEGSSGLFIRRRAMNLFKRLGDADKAAVVLSLFLLALLLGTTGCASVQKERALYLMPERVNPPDVESMFAAEYASSIQSALSNPIKTNIQRLVNTGSALARS